MPLEMGSPADRSRVRVLVSPVVELAFAFYFAEKSALKLGGSEQPWFQALERDHPDLLQRISTFWGGSGYYEWAEIVIFGQRSGTLFAEPGQFFARLEETAAQPYAVPPLPSEADGVREILQGRLNRLAASEELRATYISLLREFWGALAPYWEGGSARVAAETAAACRQRLAQVADVREILPLNHFARLAAHAELVDRAVEAGEVVVVPLALAAVGIAFFALPGVMIIGFGPEAEKRQVRRRKASETAAARFKLLSDPTRLLILTSFCSSPWSITELAAFFDLSQPTISVHVKMLREAGLLEATKVRGQTLYSSSREKVSELLDAALAEMFTG